VRAWLLGALLTIGVALTGCQDRSSPPLSELRPAPLPTLGDSAVNGGPQDSLYQVAPAEVFGEPLPKPQLVLRLVGEAVWAGEERLLPARAEGRARLLALVQGKAEVVLVPEGETFLAEAAAALAALDEAQVRTRFRHPRGAPTGAVSYAPDLKSVAEFQAWLDEVAPGKVRVIHRADGFELQTAMGKLPGPDPNGPSVPLRGGQMDLLRLREGLTLLKQRFRTAADSCLVPSYGMELRAVVEAMSAFYVGPGDPLFEQLCLVYPGPPKAAP
jgi:hypothetical protein